MNAFLQKHCVNALHVPRADALGGVVCGKQHGADALGGVVHGKQAGADARGGVVWEKQAGADARGGVFREKQPRASFQPPSAARFPPPLFLKDAGNALRQPQDAFRDAAEALR